MAKRVQFIRHLAAAADAFLGLVGELTVNRTTNAVRVHDGATIGGHEMARIDASNMQVATAGQDGKMPAAKFAEVDANTAGLAAHIGTGGVGEHPDVTPSVSGFASAADKTKLDTVETSAKDDLTAAEILALLLTVDGAASGLDADLLDGANSSDTVVASTIAKRDANSRIAAADPATGAHVVTKDHFDNLGAKQVTDIIAGSGMFGGGDLSADRTLQLDANNLSEITDGDPANDLYVMADDSDSGNTRHVKPINFGLPFSKSFTSTAQTITAAGPLVLAHTLGAAPELVQCKLVCQTDEGGFSAGDEVLIFPIPQGGNNRGMSMLIDSTNLTIRFGAAAPTFSLVHATTGVHTALTNANWKLIVKAWT